MQQWPQSRLHLVFWFPTYPQKNPIPSQNILRLYLTLYSGTSQVWETPFLEFLSVPAQVSKPWIPFLAELPGLSLGFSSLNSTQTFWLSFWILPNIGLSESRYPYVCKVHFVSKLWENPRSFLRRFCERCGSFLSLLVADRCCDTKSFCI